MALPKEIIGGKKKERMEFRGRGSEFPRKKGEKGRKGALSDPLNNKKGKVFPIRTAPVREKKRRENLARQMLRKRHMPGEGEKRRDSSNLSIEPGGKRKDVSLTLWFRAEGEEKGKEGV